MDERLENPISDRTDGKRAVLFQDESIKNVINNGFKTIFSNYDAWYFDCGYGAWLYSGSGEKNNWCSPFKGEKSQRSLFFVFFNILLVFSLNLLFLEPP